MTIAVLVASPMTLVSSGPVGHIALGLAALALAVALGSIVGMLREKR
jgi:hypothetical protein